MDSAIEARPVLLPRAPAWASGIADRISPEWKAAIAYGASAWLVSRVGLAIATYFGWFLPRQVQNQSARIPLSQLLIHWQFWDAGWYMEIAMRGYDRAQATAFFPLFPLVTRAVHAVAPSSAPIYAGLIVANLALLAALILLVRLGQLHWDGRTGRRAALLLVAYPGAFFFTSAYPLSLALAFMLATFLALQHRRWLLAGLAAAGATLTVPPGLALLVPMTYMYARTLPWSRAGWRDRGLRLDDLRALAMLAMVPAALGSYMLYLKLRFGDPLLFAKVERIYWHHYTGFLQGIASGVHRAIQIPLDTYVGARNVLDAFPILAAVIVAILALRTLPLAYSLFALTLLAINLSEPILPSYWPLQSDMRELLVIFPVFLALAVWSRRWPALHTGLLYLWLPLQGLLVLQILSGAWIV